MRQKLIAFVITVSLAFSLAGCGTGDQVPAEEIGQNPIMDFIGVYHFEDSTEAMVEADGMENARITVTYAESPWFHAQVVMSGPVDAETCAVTFSNAARTEYTYSSDGSVAEEKISYENGTGRAVFSLEDNTLTLIEELSAGDVETVFEWGPAPDMKTVTDPDHYAPVTAMDKYAIETVVGFAVRIAYLEQDWNALADMIWYPITINETELPDADAFLGYMMGKTVGVSDRQAMMDEDLCDMFVNGQGIMIGDGEIWLNDPNYMTDQEPELLIIAISGIIDEGDGETQTDDPAAETGRQDGERFEVTVVVEGMEETVRYEHIVNETLGFEMDYDYERLERYSEPERERFISEWEDPDDPWNYLEVKRIDGDAETAAAAVSEDLQERYETLSSEECTLDAAGRCVRFVAADAREEGAPSGSIQTVYVIPAGDGCILAEAHCTIESAEGFGARIAQILNTLSVIEG